MIYNQEGQSYEYHGQKFKIGDMLYMRIQFQSIMV